MTDGLYEWGKAGAPGVYLLHCTLAHGGSWKRIARRLADRYHLIAPDMVGHGKGPAGDPAVDYHDQATAHALTHLPDGPVHLIGHSFGATVALRLAIEARGRMASLTLFEPVLFAAAADGPEKTENAEVLGQMAPMIASGDTRSAAKVFLSVWGAGEDFDELPEDEVARMADQMWMIPAQQGALHHDSARLVPRLDQVACPVLLMQGEASPPVIGEILDGLSAGLADVERATIPEAGHMAPITHAGQVAERIGSFVDSVSQGSGKRAISV